MMITDDVAPHVGAWIEIGYSLTQASRLSLVAPHVGAWIEITAQR